MRRKELRSRVDGGWYGRWCRMAMLVRVVVRVVVRMVVPLVVTMMAVIVRATGECSSSSRSASAVHLCFLCGTRLLCAGWPA